MKLPWTSKLLVFSIILFSLPIYGQNTISVKKTSTTIEAIFKSSHSETKLNQYYCFKKSGYVYYFTSSLKEKKIIRNCQGQQWLKLNSSIGKYFYYQDSIRISPITYSIYGEETISDFFYIAAPDSAGLNVFAMGKEEKKKFNLLFPNPLIIQK
jgi:hypothetical protein